MEETKSTVGYTENKDYKCLEDLQGAGTYTINPWLNLDYCGFERCKPGYAFGPYVRKNYVLHIVLSGKGTLRVGGKVYQICAGQAFLLRPGIETVYQADTEDPWTYTWVGFHGSRSEKLLDNMGFSMDMDVIDVEDAQLLAGYIDQMLECRGLTYAAYLRRNGYFALMISTLMENAPISEELTCFNEETYVNMAMEEINENYGHPVSIANIANKIGINRSYLSIIFKKRTGFSPQQYLIEFRMKKAAELLLDTDHAIRVVGTLVGYSDPLTFSKAFKKKHGVSPSVFRNNPPTLYRTGTKGDYKGKYSL